MYAPQHGLILLANTLAVYYIALMVFLTYLFGLQLTALYRTYAPLHTITTLVQLETAWTLVPIAFIATCSLCTAAFLQYADVSSAYAPFTHTLHVEGAQWYWRFNGDDLRLLTIPTTLDDAHFGLPRLALTSAVATLPVHQSTLFTVTSPDVIHSLSIPALSVKLDCIPGRLSQCSPHLTTVGTYIGYCAELCGLGHSAMPLTLTVYTPTNVLPTPALYACVWIWICGLVLRVPPRYASFTLTTNNLPTAFFHRIARDYAVPLHLSPWHSLGFLVGISIASQLVTGFILACQYAPGFVEGYTSVRCLINDTSFGYLVQSLHANGAAIVMATLFLHMTRTLWYGHSTPRLALYGFIILVLLIGVCFTGYTLAACQMSYWAAAVIFRMLSVIPLVGDRLADYILAGPTPWSMTLRRVFTVHVILPFATLAVILAHVLELHAVGSVGDFTTRLDVTRIDEMDFHRLVWARDVLATLLYAWIAYVLVFVYPEILLHPDTWVPANPLVTPLSIQPEWYFMLLYAILRAIPHKGLGMLTLVLFLWSFYSLYNHYRTNESRSRLLTQRLTLATTILDFLVISYLCTHLHHYDTYFGLMLYLAVCTHLVQFQYHQSLYVPTVSPPTHDTLRLRHPHYTDLTLHIQVQEGPKLPSYWMLVVLLWFLLLTHLMLSLTTRDPHLTPLTLLVLSTALLLATISAQYDTLTWTQESTRNTIFGSYGFILFEVLLFLSVIAMLEATGLDATTPRWQSGHYAVNLYEALPVTTVSLFLLLVVTWFTHAAWSNPYELMHSERLHSTQPTAHALRHGSPVASTTSNALHYAQHRLFIYHRTLYPTTTPVSNPCTYLYSTRLQHWDTEAWALFSLWSFSLWGWCVLACMNHVPYILDVATVVSPFYFPLIGCIRGFHQHPRSFTTFYGHRLRVYCVIWLLICLPLYLYHQLRTFLYRIYWNCCCVVYRLHHVVRSVSICVTYVWIGMLDVHPNPYVRFTYAVRCCQYLSVPTPPFPVYNVSPPNSTFLSTSMYNLLYVQRIHQPDVPVCQVDPPRNSPSTFRSNPLRFNCIVFHCLYVFFLRFLHEHSPRVLHSTYPPIKPITHRHHEFYTWNAAQCIRFTTATKRCTFHCWPTNFTPSALCVICVFASL